MSKISETVNLIKHRAEASQKILERKFPSKPKDWSVLPLHYVNKTVHDICRSIPYLSAYPKFFWPLSPTGLLECSQCFL